MSIMGYDPTVYYGGRSAIEAVSMGLPIQDGEVGFRCNLVSIVDGKMRDYSGGHIGDAEARVLIGAVQESLGSDDIRFHPGVGYRHLCKMRGREETLQAKCTPPHDIPDRPIHDCLPAGPGSELLRNLMVRSVDVLSRHPVNEARVSRGELPANMVWLFWGSGVVPELPSFEEAYGLKAAMTSGVDLLKGLAIMAGVRVLDIAGVTDGLDNNHSAQIDGALEALQTDALAFVHIEAPDEAGHAGHIEEKIKAIEDIDRLVIGRLLSEEALPLRVLAMPDHPTPIVARTHTADPVPFVIWGGRFQGSGATAFSEKQAGDSGTFMEEGHGIMRELLGS
jgi:2,3-bisphosphoglycerate-independent phosphoglycerate mutase